MTFTAHEEVYQGYTIKIDADDMFDLNPRTDYDNAGTMVCWHRRSNLGDALTNNDWWHGRDFGAYGGDVMEAFDAWLTERRKERKSKDAGVIVLPLFLYEHGGMTMRTSGFSCPWDSGQVGFIYITYEDARKEWGEGKAQRLTAKARQQAIDCLKGEVETYDDFLTGNVWGYIVGDSLDDSIESCWGFLGDRDKCGVLEEARATVDAMVRRGELADGGVDNDEADEDMDEEVAEYATRFPNIAAD